MLDVHEKEIDLVTAIEISGFLKPFHYLHEAEWIVDSSLVLQLTRVISQGSPEKWNQ